MATKNKDNNASPSASLPRGDFHDSLLARDLLKLAKLEEKVKKKYQITRIIGLKKFSLNSMALLSQRLESWSDLPLGLLNLMTQAYSIAKMLTNKNYY
jgi:hypothetical protein